MTFRVSLRTVLFAGTAVLFACPAPSQSPAAPRQLSSESYARAEKMLSYSVNPLVAHTVTAPAWIEGDRFWFRDRDADGTTYRMVSPAAKSNLPAFDHAMLAQAIAAATPGKPVPDSRHLALVDLAFTDGGSAITFAWQDARLRCTLAAAVRCVPEPASAGGGPAAADAGRRASRPESVVSPNGKQAAFIRDWNLWVRDVSTGAETQLTRDGIENFGYATDNAGWQHSDRAILVWSPDSRRIATFQQDQRKTGEMVLVPVTNTHATPEIWRYPMVGDQDVIAIERVVIDVPSATVVRLKMPPDTHRSTVCDDVSCNGGWDDVQWAPDSARLAFASSSRDHRQVWLRTADAATGEVHEVYTETAPKFFEAGYNHVNWRYLPRSNEFLWFSERSGWGEMYLYDLATGQLKKAVTTGDGNVTVVLAVDEAKRRLFFLGAGREPGMDPYYVQLYSVGFDGKGLKRLTPGDRYHDVTMSGDGRYFVDVASAPTEPQVTMVRDRDGHEVMPVAAQDVSRLRAAGWKPLTLVTVKARDGKTDLYGYMFTPTTIEAGRKYPVVDYIYPGPWNRSCGERTFSASHGDNQALAELGFVVVCIDGMGTDMRSKAFHEAYYGNLGDDTIPDQVAGIKQLAAKYPMMDPDRVGIWGHSGGGNATVSAMLHFPDFFKVGIAESGNHDQRDYEDDWAEKWAGLEVKNADGTSNYDSQANQNYVQSLKGHLLLAHGTMDDNVPPNNTLFLVDALIKANKDFDLVMIPNAHHGYGAASPYMMRRRWDYFVRYLGGETPPEHYRMKTLAEAMKLAQGPDPSEQTQ